MAWGSYSAKFDKLTPSEKLWVATHPACIPTIEENAAKALSEAQRRFHSSTLHNGTGDAFRHCYWSALMTRDMGFLNTKGFTDAHEEWDGNPAGEKAMDRIIIYRGWSSVSETERLQTLNWQRFV